MIMLLLGSHVGMSGREMMLGSAKEAVSYGANTFMLYTGAPQNTKRKELSALRIPEAWAYMQAHGIEQFVVHAPYIINLANSVNPSTYEIAVDFLALEIERTIAMGSHTLILHPGSHVGAGSDIGIARIAQGLNAVLTKDTDCCIAAIYDKVTYSDKLRVCMDTCHLNDAGYDIVNDFDGVVAQFDKLIGKDQIALFHINDSKNERGAGKDRHANIGAGTIGTKALYDIVHHPLFLHLPKILETPYIPSLTNPDKKVPPYKEEITLLSQPFLP